MRRAPEQHWFTSRKGAGPEVVAVISRETLVAVRGRLETIQIDLISDEAWPEAAADAVEELRALMLTRRSARAALRGRDPGITATIDPNDDRELELVLAVAPYTICGTGLAAGRRPLVWSVDDTGTSLAFALTPDELATVRARLREAGHSEDDLVRFEP